MGGACPDSGGRVRAGQERTRIMRLEGERLEIWRRLYMVVDNTIDGAANAHRVEDDQVTGGSE